MANEVACHRYGPFPCDETRICRSNIGQLKLPILEVRNNEVFAIHSNSFPYPFSICNFALNYANLKLNNLRCNKVKNDKSLSHTNARLLCFRRMSAVKVVVCEEEHCHPIAESMIQHITEHQYGVAFPEQVGKACLSQECIIYADVLQQIHLAKCPISGQRSNLYTTYERSCYPQSSYILLPEEPKVTRMSMRTPRLILPEHSEYDSTESEESSPIKLPPGLIADKNKDLEEQNFNKLTGIPKLPELNYLGKSFTEMENLPINRFPPGLNVEIVNRTLQLV